MALDVAETCLGAPADLDADVYVDGVREVAKARLKSSRGLSDRIVLGADHMGRWPLQGNIRDFALFRGPLPPQFRAAVEDALAKKHGIPARDRPAVVVRASVAGDDDGDDDDDGDEDGDFFDDAIDDDDGDDDFEEALEGTL